MVERPPGDRAVWEQHDLDWEALVDEARRLGPDPTLEALGDDDLEHDVCTVAAQLAALTARWLDLLCELVVRGIWADQGARTPAQWLSWRIGLAPATAREHVRVALRLRELPKVRAAFAAGTLSYSKVRAITRIAVPEVEDLVLRWADQATGAQLERVAADFRRSRRAAEQPEVPDADQADAAGYRWDERSHADGTMTITLRCPVEEGVELRARLERRLDLAATTDEHAGQHRGTAALVRELLDVVVGCAADEPLDTSGLDRHTLVLHAPVAALQGGDEPDIVAVDDPRGRVRVLDRRTLRRLACDAGIVLTAVDEAGSPLDVGRRDRRLSAALRRAVHLRDQTCRFPGCDASRHLHAHHVRHWADGGPTDLGNLALLCSHHHRFVHDRGYDIEVRPDGGHRFTRPDGRTVPRHRSFGPAEGTIPIVRPNDPDTLRPRDCEVSLPRGSRDVIVSVLDQQLRRLAPDLQARRFRGSGPALDAVG
ncbi:MAG: DUF222 domain-containing protein [Actinomycetota bacterium]